MLQLEMLLLCPCDMLDHEHVSLSKSYVGFALLIEEKKEKENQGLVGIFSSRFEVEK